MLEELMDTLSNGISWTFMEPNIELSRPAASTQL